MNHKTGLFLGSFLCILWSFLKVSVHMYIINGNTFGGLLKLFGYAWYS